MAPSRGSDRLYRVAERQAGLMEAAIEGGHGSALASCDGEVQGVAGA